MTTTRQFFAKYACTRPVVDRFLDARAHNWARFDPVLGYTHADFVVRDGIDHSHTTNRMAADGSRHSPSAHGRPCRINTYGDSFTHCDQVSDGETWQEYLAAHLGEPVRNFGTGGHGVYQAWRRLLREEESANAAPYVIVNLFEDDHRRSVMSWRWLDLWEGYYERCRATAEASSTEAAYFHNGPWDHLAWDLERQDFVERRSLCPEPEDLYRLCDPEWLQHTFRHDWYAQLALAKKGVTDVDRELLRAHADAFGMALDTSDADALAASAWRLHTEVGLRSTLWVLDRLRAYIANRGKRLLILLSYGEANALAPIRGKAIEDAIVVERLRASGVPLVDIRDHHARDYRDFACDLETYGKRYWIGHYNPRGNHFFAYAIKDAVVEWLEPKPVSYRDHARDAVANVARMTGGATVGGGR